MTKYIIGLILLTLLACGTASPRPTAPPIPINEAAADRLVHNFGMALEEARGGYEAQLRITDEEITSLAALRLAQSGQVPVQRPQIWFRSERVHVTGLLNGIETELVLTARVEQGQIITQVETGQMGGFPLPAATQTSLTQTINEGLRDALPDLTVTGLELRQGELVITGRR